MNDLILLVEDNEQILYGNERMLKRRGYDVVTAASLAEARGLMADAKPDAAILDIVLPDGSGLDFMRELRRDSSMPILLLTGLKTPEDVVRGLAEGGDDYLTKPYNFSELLARVEALLRRAGRMPETIRKGALTLDIVAGQALLDDVDLLLTQKEFSLLLLFVKNEDETMSTGFLYEKIWGQPMQEDSGAFRQTLSRLRKKLKQSGFAIERRGNEGYSFLRSCL